ncbi:hypothetical protein SDC9_205838 [bioreactor metagenome]|uniref:Uncharacterized protein n=1 Tax=bioreactor metagenome TaxID=1076179 RepID=A0A645J420_9ZZZZ
MNRLILAYYLVSHELGYVDLVSSVEILILDPFVDGSDLLSPIFFHLIPRFE